MNREAIFSALFAKLEAIPGFNTSSRRLRHWSDVPREEQPALFMAQGDQTPETVTGQPTKWTLAAEIYIYVTAGDDEAPGAVINPLLDAVCNAINAPHPITGRSTLPVDGVEFCRVSGTIETDEGTLGDQAVAIVPISILAT